MVRGLYTAWTGLRNEQNRMDTMTNNLANVSTVGFKKEGTTSQSFDEVFAYRLKDCSVNLKDINYLGGNRLGVKIGENYVDYSEGPMRVTDNALDLALTDEGFFAVEFMNRAEEVSVKYTRAGQFMLDYDGCIVNANGDFLLDTEGQHIELDPLKEVRVERDGGVYQDDTRVATIQVQDFEDYDYLERYGETYFQPLEGARFKDSESQVESGVLEMANVSPVTEMVNMIAISRQYETMQKVVQTMDTSLEPVANSLGKNA